MISRWTRRKVKPMNVWAAANHWIKFSIPHFVYNNKTNIKANLKKCLYPLQTRANIRSNPGQSQSPSTAEITSVVVNSKCDVHAWERQKTKGCDCFGDLWWIGAQTGTSQSEHLIKSDVLMWGFNPQSSIGVRNRLGFDMILFLGQFNWTKAWIWIDMIHLNYGRYVFMWYVSLSWHLEALYHVRNALRKELHEWGKFQKPVRTSSHGCSFFWKHFTIKTGKYNTGQGWNQCSKRHKAKKDSDSVTQTRTSTQQMQFVRKQDKPEIFVKTEDWPDLWGSSTSD